MGLAGCGPLRAYAERLGPCLQGPTPRFCLLPPSSLLEAVFRILVARTRNGNPLARSRSKPCHGLRVTYEVPETYYKILLDRCDVMKSQAPRAWFWGTGGRISS